MHRIALRVAACATLVGVVTLAACGDKHMGPAPTGNISLTVSSANKVTPAVVVSGPGGYSKMVSGTQVLTGLHIGNYSIVADSATLADSVVGSMLDTGVVTGSPATLTARDTAMVTASYALKQRYGAMWVGNLQGNAIDALANVALRASGSPTPVDTLPLAAVSGLALDNSGNLWTADNARQIREYTVAERAGSGDTAAAITIVDSAIAEPYSMAFDSHGNLWVGNSGALRAYSPAQLATGGIDTAAIVITSGALGLTPGMAFDANGNLWVSNFSNSTLLMYTAAQLAASGAIDPADTLRGISALSGPAGMAFDAHDNLWVANHSSPSLVMFTPNQLTASGSPTPPVVITTPSGAGALMWGMAFDASATLWVVGAGNDSIMAFTAAQQTATGSPTPIITLGAATAGQFAFASNIVFDSYLPIGLNGTGLNRIRGTRVARRAVASARLRRLPDTPFFRGSR